MIGRKRKAKKSDDYIHYLGDYVAIYFKETKLFDKDDNGEEIEINGIQGYVIDVTEHSILIGVSPDTLFGTVDLDDIGFCRLAENIPDELKFPTPPDGEQH